MKTALAWIIRIIGLTLGVILFGGAILLMGWMCYDSFDRLGVPGVFTRAWPSVVGVAAVGVFVALFVWASDHLKR